MRRVKYIKTNIGCIIAFPEAMNHSDFRFLNPVSAGFLELNTLGDKPYYSAYGESESLGLKPDVIDGEYATSQLLPWI